MVAVQLRVPDTNTPASPKIQQQQRSSNHNPLSSDYSLFELETFFTRWAPDNDSVSAPGGPSCSFTSGDSTECDQDGVIIVETEPPPQHVLPPPQGSVSSAVRISVGQSFSDRSNVHIQPSVSQARTSGSSEPPWSRTSAMIRSAQAQLLQQHRISNRIPSEQRRLSSASAAVSHTDNADKTTISGISSTSRTMSSTIVPQSVLPDRGTTTAFASIEAIAAQHQASLLAPHNNSKVANIMPGERRRKSYICRACGKAFSGLSNLEAHERVHTGEKPFRCDTCGKRFSEAGNLKKHQRVHTGEKPFSCEQCGKRFAWICNLRTHQQSATGCGPLTRGGLGLG